MALQYQDNGNLEPGIHELPWEEFANTYRYTYQRKFIINGMKVALNALKNCGCRRVYIDGSFVTQKETPGDWDGCFDPAGMNMEQLHDNYPVFFDIDHPRLQQKMLFKGEIFPCTTPVGRTGKTFLDFFQQDKYDHTPKGIIQLSLQNLIL